MQEVTYIELSSGSAIFVIDCCETPFVVDVTYAKQLKKNGAEYAGLDISDEGVTTAERILVHKVTPELVNILEFAPTVELSATMCSMNPKIKEHIGEFLDGFAEVLKEKKAVLVATDFTGLDRLKELPNLIVHVHSEFAESIRFGTFFDDYDGKPLIFTFTNDADSYMKEVFPFMDKYSAKPKTQPQSIEEKIVSALGVVGNHVGACCFNDYLDIYSDLLPNCEVVKAHSVAKATKLPPRCEYLIVFDPTQLEKVEQLFGCQVVKDGESGFKKK
jgi:hypothetical protein